MERTNLHWRVDGADGGTIPVVEPATGIEIGRVGEASLGDLERSWPRPVRPRSPGRQCHSPSGPRSCAALRTCGQTTARTCTTGSCAKPAASSQGAVRSVRSGPGVPRVFRAALPRAGRSSAHRPRTVEMPPDPGRGGGRHLAIQHAAQTGDPLGGACPRTGQRGDPQARPAHPGLRWRRDRQSLRGGRAACRSTARAARRRRTGLSDGRASRRNAVSFTGSTQAGRSVGELAARHFTRAHLELGGNNAMIVLPDADLDNGMNALAYGSFFNQGQGCMIIGRHLVTRSRHWNRHDLCLLTRLSVGSRFCGCQDRRGDHGHLVVRKLRVERQADNLRGEPLARLEPPSERRKIAICRLQMHRRRIVNGRVDSHVRQSGAEPVAVSHLDDEEVVNVTSTACLYRRDCSGTIQLGSIAMRKNPSAVVPFVQVRSLAASRAAWSASRRLFRPRRTCSKRALLAVVAKQAGPRCHVLVVVTTAPPSPSAPRFLVGIEAERGGVAEGARPAPVRRRRRAPARSLRSHGARVPEAISRSGCEVGALAIEVDRHDRAASAAVSAASSTRIDA